MRHELHEAWELGETAICRGEVCYERANGTAVTVPFANIFKRRDGLICEYRIYVDASAVFGIPRV